MSTESFLRSWIVARPQILANQTRVVELYIDNKLSYIEVAVKLAKYEYPSPFEAEFDEIVRDRLKVVGVQRQHMVEMIEQELSTHSAPVFSRLAALRAQGTTWPPLSSSQNFTGYEIESDVCAYLSSVDPAFDAITTMSLLEDPRKVAAVSAKKQQLEAKIAEYANFERQHVFSLALVGRTPYRPCSAAAAAAVPAASLAAFSNPYNPDWAPTTVAPAAPAAPSTPPPSYEELSAAAAALVALDSAASPPKEGSKATKQRNAARKRAKKAAALANQTAASTTTPANPAAASPPPPLSPALPPTPDTAATAPPLAAIATALPPSP